VAFMERISAGLPGDARPRGCQGCRDGMDLPFAFTMAFQPIVYVEARRVWAYEALVRGVNGEGAGSILDLVERSSIYGFDQACRVKAVELAGKLFDRDDDTKLSINFMPNAVYEPNACIRATLDAARRARFRQDRIMFEFTENEQIRDIPHVRRVRIHTRTPVVLPSRVDAGLIAALQPVRAQMAIVIHANHPAELPSVRVWPLDVHAQWPDRQLGALAPQGRTSPATGRAVAQLVPSAR